MADDRPELHEVPTPGQRFLYAKTGQPITVQHIEHPEPGGDNQTCIGVEFDDARAAPAPKVSSWWVSQPGAGHYIRWEPGKTPFLPGVTLVEALEERYGPLEEETAPRPQTAPSESVVLGSSNAAIVVEAPGMEAVRRRMARLERRREIGFDGEWVARLGGTERQRELFKQRLKGVRVLDLSRNLVETWGDMAEIVEHLPGLTTLIINRSRIAPIAQNEAEEFAEKYRTAFQNITDLHMGSGVERWDEVGRFFVQMFPNLKTLDLHNDIRLDSLGPTDGVLDGLTSLNLDNSPLDNWEDLAAHLTQLPKLESLSLAGTPLRPKPIPSLHGASFPALRRLSLEGTRIERYRWRDIDHLADWVPLLENLRISCDVDGDADATPEFNALFMSGQPRVDRPFVIAKLRNLTMLNGTPISAAERTDAELYYLRCVNNLGLAHPAASWGRFEELVELHGPGQKDAPRQTTLKSRLISLNVIPPSGLSFKIGILPSAPVSLLQKKIAKKLNAPSVSVWTARKHEAVDGVWEPVEELEDGREVERYATDGDTVVVVL